MMQNLDALARLEQLARHCARNIAASLEPGMTEETAASLLRQGLRQHGVTDLPHRPLAWFGDRTRLAGAPANSGFASLRPGYFPGERKLEQRHPFALYCAVRKDGLVAEAFHCDSLGTHPGYQQLLAKTGHLKTLLLHAVNQRQPLGALTHLAHQLAQAQGLVLCDGGIAGTWLRPYHAQPESGFLQQGLLGKVVELTGNQAPAHLPDTAMSQPADLPLAPGLWVVQPWLDDGHLGAGLRSLLYISAHGKAGWLNPAFFQTRAA